MLVAYLAQHDPLEPVVDNNWKITGVDLQLDNPERAAYIEKINSGALATPYNKSINLNEANNVVVNGKLYSAAELQGFYRLRDIATAFAGTTAGFNVEWVKGQVVITTGAAYTTAALPAVTVPAFEASGTITVLVDGKPVDVAAELYQGNYYVSLGAINTLLGIQATQADGVITLTADKAADAGNGNAG